VNLSLDGVPSKPLSLPCIFADSTSNVGLAGTPDVLAEEAVLNSSTDLAVSKATLATDVSKESYLVKLSLVGVPSKPLDEDDIFDESLIALTKNSMARNVQRWYRLSKGGYDEQNRRCDQRCVKAITDFNWKYFKKGSYEGPNVEDFLEAVEFLREGFQPFDDTCSYLTNGNSLSFRDNQKMVEETWNEHIYSTHVKYIEAKFYLGKDISVDDLYSAWDDCTDTNSPCSWM